MNRGYRHLSESSDGSTNTKSTQTTNLSSNSSGLENIPRQQLPTVMEDNTDDFRYADEEDNADKYCDMNDNTIIENKQLKKTFDRGCGDNSPDERLCHWKTLKRNASVNCEEVGSSVSYCGCCLLNNDPEPCDEEATNGIVTKNSKDSHTINKTGPNKTSKHTETLGKGRVHQTAKKQNKTQTDKTQTVSDTHKISLGEQNSYDACSTWNNASPDICMDIDEETQSTTSKSHAHYIESFQQRDRNIHDFQYGNIMMKTLEDRYNNMITDMNRKQELLKSSLLWLTVMFIVIILCVAVSMIYNISRNMDHVSIADVDVAIERYLELPEVREELSSEVLCVECTDVSADAMSLFSRDSDNGCCIKDMATFWLQMKEVFSEDLQNHDNRLINMKKTLYELEQKANYQSFIINVGEANESGNVVDLDNVLESTFLKIESNERMINALLERRRSSLHLIGRVDGRKQLQWQYKAGNMKPMKSSNSPTISVTGGSYFVYCTIRFTCDQIRTDGRVSVGYKLDEVGRRGGPQSLASIEHHCTNGSTTEHDLVLQRIVSVPVNQGKTIRLSVLNHILQYVSNTHDHSFGIFEI